MSFLQDYQQLVKSVPKAQDNNGRFSENILQSEYTSRSKNCTYCYDCTYLENGCYCGLCLGKTIVDCDNCITGELLYECVDCTNCFASSFLDDCTGCGNCHFCTLCTDCTDCYGCVGLLRKKYCIYNKQFKQSTYKATLLRLAVNTPSAILQTVYQSTLTVPHPPNTSIKSSNSTYGDYIRNSSNCYWCFNTLEATSSGYIYHSGQIEDCWDLLASGLKSEMCYELVGSSQCYSCAFLDDSYGCSDCHYGSSLRNCTHCFGCIGLSNKSFCVLNKQLKNSEYMKIVCAIRSALGWGNTA
jgi:hypothetical protein